MTINIFEIFHWKGTIKSRVRINQVHISSCGLEKSKVSASPVLVHICEALNAIPNNDWALRRRMLQQRPAREFDDKLFYLLACITVLIRSACQEKVNPPGLCACMSVCMIFFSFACAKLCTYKCVCGDKITLINSKGFFFPHCFSLQ